MTPAINLLKKAQITHRVHQYQHEADAQSFGSEAADKLNISPQQVFKTLVVELDTGKLAVAVLPVSGMLSLKQMAKACDVKKASMAEHSRVERSSGYVLGGVSPLAQKKTLKTIIDASAQTFENIYISAGRRGLEIELSAHDLARILNARFSTIQQ